MKKDQRQPHQAISPALSLETEDFGLEMGPDGRLRCIGSEEPWLEFLRRSVKEHESKYFRDQPDEPPR